MDEKTYMELKDAIEHIYVEMPWGEDTTVKEMQGWMNGYAVCHKSVLEILENFKPRPMPWE